MAEAARPIDESADELTGPTASDQADWSADPEAKRKGWTVKGVPPAVREQAKTAAHSQGQTLGAWLNALIANAAEGVAPDVAERPGARGVERRGDAALIDDVVDKIGDRIDAAMAEVGVNARRMRRLTEAMLEMAVRLEDVEDAALGREERLARLEREARQPAALPAPERQEPSEAQAARADTPDWTALAEYAEAPGADAAETDEDGSAFAPARPVVADEAASPAPADRADEPEARRSADDPGGVQAEPADIWAHVDDDVWESETDAIDPENGDADVAGFDTPDFDPPEFAAPGRAAAAFEAPREFRVADVEDQSRAASTEDRAEADAAAFDIPGFDAPETGATGDERVEPHAAAEPRAPEAAPADWIQQIGADDVEGDAEAAEPPLLLGVDAASAVATEAATDDATADRPLEWLPPPSVAGRGAQKLDMADLRRRIQTTSVEERSPLQRMLTKIKSASPQADGDPLGSAAPEGAPALDAKAAPEERSEPAPFASETGGEPSAAAPEADAGRANAAPEPAAAPAPDAAPDPGGAPAADAIDLFSGALARDAEGAPRGAAASEAAPKKEPEPPAETAPADDRSVSTRLANEIARQVDTALRGDAAGRRASWLGARARADGEPTADEQLDAPKEPSTPAAPTIPDPTRSRIFELSADDPLARDGARPEERDALQDFEEVRSDESPWASRGVAYLLVATTLGVLLAYVFGMTQ